MADIFDSDVNLETFKKVYAAAPEKRTELLAEVEASFWTAKKNTPNYREEERKKELAISGNAKSINEAEAALQGVSEKLDGMQKAENFYNGYEKVTLGAVMDAMPNQANADLMRDGLHKAVQNALQTGNMDELRADVAGLKEKYNKQSLWGKIKNYQNNKALDKALDAAAQFVAVQRDKIVSNPAMHRIFCEKDGFDADRKKLEKDKGYYSYVIERCQNAIKYKEQEWSRFNDDIQKNINRDMENVAKIPSISLESYTGEGIVIEDEVNIRQAASFNMNFLGMGEGKSGNYDYKTARKAAKLIAAAGFDVTDDPEKAKNTGSFYLKGNEIMTPFIAREDIPKYKALLQMLEEHGAGPSNFNIPTQPEQILRDKPPKANVADIAALVSEAAQTGSHQLPDGRATERAIEQKYSAKDFLYRGSMVADPTYAGSARHGRQGVLYACHETIDAAAYSGSKSMDGAGFSGTGEKYVDNQVSYMKDGKMTTGYIGFIHVYKDNGNRMYNNWQVENKKYEGGDEAYETFLTNENPPVATYLTISNERGTAVDTVFEIPAGDKRWQAFVEQHGVDPEKTYSTAREGDASRAELYERMKAQLQEFKRDGKVATASFDNIKTAAPEMTKVPPRPFQKGPEVVQTPPPPPRVDANGNVMPPPPPREDEKSAGKTRALNEAFGNPRPQQPQTSDMRVSDAARTDDPNVMYALDGQGNRLFSYTPAPGMSQEHIAQLAGMINRACKSPTGRDTLQQASEMGHTFRLYNESDGRGGYYDNYRREICMNMFNGNEDFMCSALVHEARHSIQFDQIPQFAERFRDFAGLDFKSSTIVNRAIEADAVAIQAKFNVEMALAGDKGPYEAMYFHSSKNVSEFMMQAASQGKLNDPETLRQGADKWYESAGLIKYYDNYYARVEQGRIQNGGNRNSLTDEDLNVLTASLFNVRGQQYAGDSGEYLKTAQKTMLTEKAYNDVKQANARCGKTDNSVDSMAVFNEFTGKAMEITHAERCRMDASAYLKMKGEPPKAVMPPPPPRVDANGNVMPPPPPRTATNGNVMPPPPPRVDANGNVMPPPPPRVDANGNVMPPPPPRVDANGNVMPPPPPRVDANGNVMPPPPPRVDANGNVMPPPPPRVDANGNVMPPPPPRVDANGNVMPPPPPRVDANGNVMPPPPPRVDANGNVMPPPPPRVDANGNVMPPPPPRTATNGNVMPPPPPRVDANGNVMPPPPPRVDANGNVMPPPPPRVDANGNVMPPPPPRVDANGNVMPPPPPTLQSALTSMTKKPTLMQTLQATSTNRPPMPQIQNVAPHSAAGNGTQNAAVNKVLQESKSR